MNEFRPFRVFALGFGAPEMAQAFLVDDGAGGAEAFEVADGAGGHETFYVSGMTRQQFVVAGGEQLLTADGDSLNVG